MLKNLTPLRLSTFILIFISFSCSFDNNRPIDSPKDEAEKEIRYLEADDENVKRAYIEAQQNLPELEDYFNKNDNDQYLLYLKKLNLKKAERLNICGVFCLIFLTVNIKFG